MKQAQQLQQIRVSKTMPKLNYTQADIQEQYLVSKTATGTANKVRPEHDNNRLLSAGQGQEQDGQQGAGFGAKKRAKSSESGHQSTRTTTTTVLPLSGAGGDEIGFDYDQQTNENRQPVQLAGSGGNDDDKSHSDRKRRRRSQSASRLLSSCFHIPNFASSIVHHHSSASSSGQSGASSSKKTSILSHFRLGSQQHKNNDQNKRPLSNSQTVGNLPLAAATNDQNNGDDDNDNDDQGQSQSRDDLRMQAQQSNQRDSQKHVSFENQKQLALAAAAASGSASTSQQQANLSDQFADQSNANLANVKRQTHPGAEKTFNSDEPAPSSSVQRRQPADNVIMQAAARQQQHQQAAQRVQYCDHHQHQLQQQQLPPLSLQTQVHPSPSSSMYLVSQQRTPGRSNDGAPMYSEESYQQQQPIYRQPIATSTGFSSFIPPQAARPVPSGSYSGNDNHQYNKQPQQVPNIYKRLASIPMRTQATQTDITAYHLMASPSTLSHAGSGSLAGPSRPGTAVTTPSNIPHRAPVSSRLGSGDTLSSTSVTAPVLQPQTIPSSQQSTPVMGGAAGALTTPTTTSTKTSQAPVSLSIDDTAPTQTTASNSLDSQTGGKAVRAAEHHQRQHHHAHHAHQQLANKSHEPVANFSKRDSGGAGGDDDDDDEDDDEVTANMNVASLLASSSNSSSSVSLVGHDSALADTLQCDLRISGTDSTSVPDIGARGAPDAAGRNRATISQERSGSRQTAPDKGKPAARSIIGPKTGAVVSRDSGDNDDDDNNCRWQHSGGADGGRGRRRQRARQSSGSEEIEPPRQFKDNGASSSSNRLRGAPPDAGSRDADKRQARAQVGQLAPKPTKSGPGVQRLELASQGDIGSVSRVVKYNNYSEFKPEEAVTQSASSGHDNITDGAIDDGNGIGQAEIDEEGAEDGARGQASPPSLSEASSQTDASMASSHVLDRISRALERAESRQQQQQMQQQRETVGGYKGIIPPAKTLMTTTSVAKASGSGGGSGQIASSLGDTGRRKCSLSSDAKVRVQQRRISECRELGADLSGVGGSGQAGPTASRAPIRLADSNQDRIEAPADVQRAAVAPRRKSSSAATVTRTRRLSSTRGADVAAPVDSRRASREHGLPNVGRDYATKCAQQSSTDPDEQAKAGASGADNRRQSCLEPVASTSTSEAKADQVQSEAKQRRDHFLTMATSSMAAAAAEIVAPSGATTATGTSSKSFECHTCAPATDASSGGRLNSLTSSDRRQVLGGHEAAAAIAATSDDNSGIYARRAPNLRTTGRVSTSTLSTRHHSYCSNSSSNNGIAAATAATATAESGGAVGESGAGDDFFASVGGDEEDDGAAEERFNEPKLQQHQAENRFKANTEQISLESASQVVAPASVTTTNNRANNEKPSAATTQRAPSGRRNLAGDILRWAAVNDQAGTGLRGIQDAPSQAVPVQKRNLSSELVDTQAVVDNDDDAASATAAAAVRGDRPFEADQFMKQFHASALDTNNHLMQQQQQQQHKPELISTATVGRAEEHSSRKAGKAPNGPDKSSGSAGGAPDSVLSSGSDDNGHSHQAGPAAIRSSRIASQKQQPEPTPGPSGHKVLREVESIERLESNEGGSGGARDIKRPYILEERDTCKAHKLAEEAGKAVALEPIATTNEVRQEEAQKLSQVNWSDNEPAVAASAAVASVEPVSSSGSSVTASSSSGSSSSTSTTMTKLTKSCDSIVAAKQELGPRASDTPSGSQASAPEADRQRRQSASSSKDAGATTTAAAQMQMQRLDQGNGAELVVQRQGSSPSPPTTVSELDQDEELSMPSFVDNYKRRLESQVGALANSVVTNLIGECLLATGPSTSQAAQVPPTRIISERPLDEPGPSGLATATAASVASFKRDQLAQGARKVKMAHKSTSLASASSSSSSSSSVSSSSSSSSSSTRSSSSSSTSASALSAASSAASATLASATLTSKSSTTSADANVSYVCQPDGSMQREQPRPQQATNLANRPKLPDKPAHLCGQVPPPLPATTTTTEKTASGSAGLSEQEERKDHQQQQQQQQEHAAAVAVTATSMAAAAAAAAIHSESNRTIGPQQPASASGQVATDQEPASSALGLSRSVGASGGELAAGGTQRNAQKEHELVADNLIDELIRDSLPKVGETISTDTRPVAPAADQRRRSSCKSVQSVQSVQSTTTWSFDEPPSVVTPTTSQTSYVATVKSVDKDDERAKQDLSRQTSASTRSGPSLSSSQSSMVACRSSQVYDSRIATDGSHHDDAGSVLSAPSFELELDPECAELHEQPGRGDLSRQQQRRQQQQQQRQMPENYLSDTTRETSNEDSRSLDRSALSLDRSDDRSQLALDHFGAQQGALDQILVTGSSELGSGSRLVPVQRQATADQTIESEPRALGNTDMDLARSDNTISETGQLLTMNESDFGADKSLILQQQQQYYHQQAGTRGSVTRTDSAESSLRSSTDHSGWQHADTNRTPTTQTTGPVTISAELHNQQQQQQQQQQQMQPSGSRRRSFENQSVATTSASGQQSRVSPVDCPYVHDIQPLAGSSPLAAVAAATHSLETIPKTSLASGQPVALAQQQQQSGSTISPASSSLIGCKRLSHDDTMEAIEDDVEGEEHELKLIQQEQKGQQQQPYQSTIPPLESPHLMSIAPPEGFCSASESTVPKFGAATDSGGSAAEQASLYRQLSLGPSPVGESIMEEDENELDDDDDEDDESSISVSQRHGVVVTQEVIGGKRQHVKRHRERKEADGASESTHHQPPPVGKDEFQMKRFKSKGSPGHGSSSASSSSPSSTASNSPKHQQASATTSPTSSSGSTKTASSAGSSTNQTASRSGSQREPLVSGGGDVDGDGGDQDQRSNDSTPTGGPKQAQFAQQLPPSSGPVGAAPKSLPTCGSSESATHAILDHLSQLYKAPGPLDEPALSLEQSHSIDRQESSATSLQEEEPSLDHGRYQTGAAVPSPPSLQGSFDDKLDSSSRTGTMKRRRNSPPASGLPSTTAGPTHESSSDRTRTKADKARGAQPAVTDQHQEQGQEQDRDELQRQQAETVAMLSEPSQGAIEQQQQQRQEQSQPAKRRPPLKQLKSQHNQATDNQRGESSHQSASLDMDGSICSSCSCMEASFEQPTQAIREPQADTGGQLGAQSVASTGAPASAAASSSSSSATVVQSRIKEQQQSQEEQQPQSQQQRQTKTTSSSAWMSQEEGMVFTENYWLSHWLYISEHEEAEIWRRAIDMSRPASAGPTSSTTGHRAQEQQSSSTASAGGSKSLTGQATLTQRDHTTLAAGGGSADSGASKQRQQQQQSETEPTDVVAAAGMPRDMTETGSTVSERSFGSRYKSTTRKMIHRRASIEMYKRIMNNNLKTEKRVEISRSNGEFGFRIHGSRPVVVSAIERGTSAETCGLQVGDLIYAINGTNILDMAHSDVVRLAHNAESAALVLDLIPTNDFLRMSKYNRAQNKRYEPTVTGFLMRLSPTTAQPLLVELQEHMSQHATGASHHQRAAELNKVMRLAWRQRYFVLRSDNCLYWYKSPQDAVEPHGGINLQGFSATLTDEFSEPNYVIRLVKYGGQPHYLGSNNMCDVQTWVDAINKAATEANQNDPYMKRTLILARGKPNQIQEPDCSGWLYKFSHKRGGGAHWRAAYFVLKDACLYLFRDQKAELVDQASAVYYLHGYRVRSKHIEHKKHTFELVPPNRKTIKPMFLMASNEIDKKRWIAALEYSIDRWIEID